MIIATKAQIHDKPFRMVMYHPDEAGRCAPRYEESEHVENIHAYYEQRAIEMKRLHEAVIAGDISPVAFFVQYQRLDIRDVASRVGLRPGVVKKHMTMAGFTAAKVADLQRYARVFDVSVGDFFEFTFIDDAIAVTSERFHERLIHQAKFETASPAGEHPDTKGGNE